MTLNQSLAVELYVQWVTLSLSVPVTLSLDLILIMFQPILLCSLGLNWIQVSLEVASVWLSCSGRLYGLVGVSCFLAPGVLVALGVLWIGGGRFDFPVLVCDFLFTVLPDLALLSLVVALVEGYSMSMSS